MAENNLDNRIYNPSIGWFQELVDRLKDIYLTHIYEIDEKEKLELLIRFIEDFIINNNINSNLNLNQVDTEYLGSIYEKYFVINKRRFGIYYTPSIIAEFMVKNSLKEIIDKKLRKFKDAIIQNNLNFAETILNEIFSIKILDPACGTGIFILKSFNFLIEKYADLSNFLKNELKKFEKEKQKPMNQKKKFNFLKRISGILDISNNKVEFLLKIILKHLFINDLDKNALRITILNLWIEFLKNLSNQDYRILLFQDFCNLIWNLNTSNADYILQPEDNKLVSYISKKYKESIINLKELRERVTENPFHFQLLDEVKLLKRAIFKQLIYNTDLFGSFKNHFNDESKLFVLCYSNIFFDKEGGLLDGCRKGFNVIIGNPPYVPWYKILNRKFLEHKKFIDLEFECRLKHEDAHPNLYLFFLVKSINLVNNGLITFILPHEWLNQKYARRFRDYFLEKSNSIKLIRLTPGLKIFKNAEGKYIGTNSLILFMEINNNFSSDRFVFDCFIRFTDFEKVCLTLLKFDLTLPENFPVKKNYSEIINQNWNFYDPQLEEIKFHINNLDNIIYLNDEDHFIVRGGFQPPIKEIPTFEVDEKIYEKLSDYEKKFVFPVIYNANEIDKYVINYSKKYWIVLNEIGNLNEVKDKCSMLYKILATRIKKKEGKWWFFPNIRNFKIIKSSPIKLLTRRTAKENTFAIDTAFSVFKGTNSMIVPLKLNPYYLAGILNSKLATFWYQVFGQEYHGNKYKKYEPQKLRKNCIPIVITHEKIMNEIIYYVKKICELKNHIKHNFSNKSNKVNADHNELNKINSEVQYLQNKIDKLIYKIYELNELQIKLVEFFEL